MNNESRDYYVKVNDSYGEDIRIPVIDLKFYCKCPECGKETEIPEYLEFVAENEDFDPYSGGIMCDECSDELDIMREYVTSLHSAIYRMPKDKLEIVYNLMAKYHVSEDDE